MKTVFLSPSTQEWNPYANGGNEQEQMNLIADAMEPYLTASGITYVRNDPDRNVTGAIADSNAGRYEVHLALHSNAAGAGSAGKVRGVEIYYSPYSEFGRRLAVITANNFTAVYPLPERVMTVPTTSLAEITRTRTVAVLCEIGYHDNAEDAEWIKNSRDIIAQTLVRSLCDYFGIPFILPGSGFEGIVSAGGSKLNIRDMPSVESRIIGTIPDGASVMVNGAAGGWYSVSYDGVTGYSSREFITEKG